MTKKKIVKAALKEKTYEIIIGKNILESNKKKILSKIYGAKKIFIITDSIVKKYHLKKLKKIIPNNYSIETIEILEGEKAKEIKVVEKILNFCFKKNISRTDAIFALGGGVIGDLSGFVASIVLRGVNLIHFPTTLLAQVDSSVGGKTGVNSKFGKNLIGTFYQPKLVICEINFLSTLPRRETVSGYAEVVKYAIITNKNFFLWIEKNKKKILNNNSIVISNMVKKCLLIKSSFVQQDEKDTKNKRALLNLGHTYAHALEKYTGYSKKLSHGEAVSIGICMASRLSFLLNFLSLKEFNKIEKLFVDLGLPINLNFIKKIKIKKNNIIKYMMHDKKIINGKLHFVLCKRIGKAFIYNKVNAKMIKESIS